MTFFYLWKEFRLKAGHPNHQRLKPSLPKQLLIIFIFLVSFSVFSLAFSAPPVEIYFYQRGYVAGGTEPATKLTDEAVTAFQQRRPEIRVKVVGVPWGREGDLKLHTALLARRRIDCFRLAHDELGSYIPEKGTLLAPLDPYLSAADRQDFGPAALRAVTFHGQVMAWPLWSTAIALIGNRTILEQCRIALPKERPWIWEEFRGALRQVTSATLLDGRRVDGLNGAARAPLFEWAPLLMANCGPLFAEGGRLAADGSLPLAPGLALALQKVRDLCQEHWLAPGFGVDDQPAVQSAFLEGKVAMILSSPGFIKELAGKKFPFVVMPPPTGDWGKPITTGALGCIAVVQSEDARRTAAAQALARFLTSAEIAQAVPEWYLAPPARASIHAFFAQPGYQPLAAILPTARYLPALVSTGFKEGTLIPHLQAALLGDETPRQAIDAIQAAARREAIE